jgi:hypothetical protein
VEEANEQAIDPAARCVALWGFHVVSNIGPEKAPGEPTSL